MKDVRKFHFLQNWFWASSSMHAQQNSLGGNNWYWFAWRSFFLVTKLSFSTWHEIKLSLLVFSCFHSIRYFSVNFTQYSVLKRICILLRRSFRSFHVNVLSMYYCCYISRDWHVCHFDNMFADYVLTANVWNRIMKYKSKTMMMNWIVSDLQYFVLLSVLENNLICLKILFTM